MLLAVISAFYMFIYLVAELTSVGGAVSLITGMDPLGPVLGTSLVTLAYSSFGGARAARARAPPRSARSPRAGTQRPPASRATLTRARSSPPRPLPPPQACRSRC